MNPCLESSAVLLDLLGGDRCEEAVATCRCTMPEVGRVLARLRVLEPTIAAQAAAREAQLETDSELWVIQPVDDAIWSRCSRPFPAEAVRTLDASHPAKVEKLAGVIDHIVGCVVRWPSASERGGAGVSGGARHGRLTAA